MNSFKHLLPKFLKKKMSKKDFLDEMKIIEIKFLEYLDNETNEEEILFTSLKLILADFRIQDDLYKFKSFLHLLMKISNNYHRKINFFEKITRILKLFKENIINYFSNSEIFNIFKANKRLLLYLINEGILIFDNNIFKKITTNNFRSKKYPHYFLPEIKKLKDILWIEIMKKSYFYYSNNKDWLDMISNEFPQDYEKNREISENDDFVCKMIREDSVQEFIVHVNKLNLSLHSEINSSIFETNSFLLKNLNSTKLIEYSAFYGSIQIFQYLKMNGVNLTPSLWIYAIHGKNPDIIHLLEENHVQPYENSFNTCFYESIKCHHSDITNYFSINYMQNENNGLSFGIKYHNYIFLQNQIINQSSFYDLCLYDYPFLVYAFIEEGSIDVNEIVIDIKNIFIEFLSYKLIKF